MCLSREWAGATPGSRFLIPVSRNYRRTKERAPVANGFHRNDDAILIKLRKDGGRKKARPFLSGAYWRRARSRSAAGRAARYWPGPANRFSLSALSLHGTPSELPASTLFQGWSD